MPLLDRGEAVAILNASRTRGGTYTPDCAAIHPTRLVRGLAEAVERRGVHLYEHTRVTSIEPGVAGIAGATVRADHVIRATEGYTPTLPGHSRAVVPVYSLVIATQPLALDVWAEIGLARRETFSDHRHLIIYGQRTADDRLVFGGRGAPYHFGSRVHPDYDRDDRVFARLYATLLDLFPTLCEAPRSPTPGVGPWPSRVTGAPRSGWTAAPDSPGQVVTSAMASAPATWPVGRCAT